MEEITSLKNVSLFIFHSFDGHSQWKTNRWKYFCKDEKREKLVFKDFDTFLKQRLKKFQLWKILPLFLSCFTLLLLLWFPFLGWFLSCPVDCFDLFISDLFKTGIVQLVIGCCNNFSRESCGRRMREGERGNERGREGMIVRVVMRLEG